MPHDQRSRHPKSKAGAFEALGREKWIEQVLADFFRNSWTAIVDGHSRTLAAATKNRPDANDDIRVGRRGFSGVSDQIAEDLGQLAGKSAHHDGRLALA